MCLFNYYPSPETTVDIFCKKVNSMTVNKLPVTPLFIP